MFELVQVHEPVVKGSKAFVDFCIISLTLEMMMKMMKMMMMMMVEQCLSRLLLDKEGFLANQTAAKVDKLKNETDIISIAKTIFIDITTITKPRSFSLPQ